MARAKVNKDTGLTDQQEEYAKLRAYNPKMSMSDCYRGAYKTGNMKPETVNRKAKELEDNGKITARIAELRAEVAEEAKIDASYVLRRLVEIDQMDLLDIMSEDASSFLPLSEWPKVWRQYLSAIDFSELWTGLGDDREIAGVLKKIKWPDKTKNLELLGKHVEVQAFKDKVEVEDVTNPIDLSSLNSVDREALKTILLRNSQKSG